MLGFLGNFKEGFLSVGKITSIVALKTSAIVLSKAF